MTTVGKTERYHNSAEQAREYIAGAVAIVDELEVPDDLRVAAFGNAVALLSAKQIEWQVAGAVDPALAARLGLA